ncbi:MAG TPA: sigma-70 family RNA polymerase sigma factor [Longimicrobium sp.]|jgi:RNA polymerase sigma factor for flagellar operon FliA
MLEPDTVEAARALFLEHLTWIDRAAAIACVRKGIHGADAEDFAGRVRMALIEDDYGIVRGFDGGSEFKTYLSTVIARLLVNFQREVGGRWRGSMAAQRLGPPADELERLVHREGFTLLQAGEKLRTEGRTTLSDAELARLFGQLPARTPLRPEVQEPVTGLEGQDDSRADDRVMEAEADSRRVEIVRALDAAMGQLDPEERMIVKLRYADGNTLADVARTLRLDQKPLYRRAPRLLARLLQLLESAGLRRDDVRGFLNDDDES